MKSGVTRVRFDGARCVAPGAGGCQRGKLARLLERLAEMSGGGAGLHCGRYCSNRSLVIAEVTCPSSICRSRPQFPRTATAAVSAYIFRRTDSPVAPVRFSGATTVGPHRSVAGTGLGLFRTRRCPSDFTEIADRNDVHIASCRRFRFTDGRHSFGGRCA